MKCSGFEKWISDRAGKALPVRKRKKLEAHLSRCTSCARFSEQMKILDSEVRRIPYDPPAENYFTDFSNALIQRIEAEKAPSRSTLFSIWGFRWTAAAAAAATFLLVMVYSPNRISRRAPDYFLSFEETCQDIIRSIGSDSELGEIFNALVVASIDDTIDREALSDRMEFDPSPHYYEQNNGEEGTSFDSGGEKKTKTIGG